MPKLHGNEVIQMSVLFFKFFMLISSRQWDIFAGAPPMRMSFERFLSIEKLVESIVI